MTTANFVKSVTAANPHLGAVVTLPEFLETAGALTLAKRQNIVEQALTFIDDIYVHLPLKRAMHAVDPVQRLKLLRRKLALIAEREFHNEMISIFKEMRDLHTNYILPTPYNQHTAFLPFLMEEYIESGERKYIVTRMVGGFEHETFKPGVNVTHWSGVPIVRAVEINADREAGSNESARHVRGLDAMTVRPMSQSLPPDAEWVMVGYEDGGQALELRVPWLVFSPNPISGGAAPEAPGIANEDLVAMGVDLNQELTNEARKLLFAPTVTRLSERVDDLTKSGTDAAEELETFKAENSIFPDVFEFRDVETAHGTFGYVRIRTFSLGPASFIPELGRILGLVSQNGLIIDVRGNGGGVITSGERMLKLFTDDDIETERFQFLNTDLTLKIADTDALGGFAKAWVRSIELSLVTAAAYSQGFPIEPPEVTNAIARRYPGNTIVITDARCYSTTDIFAAGYQDNKLGKILGVDGNTGAGGANVFGHDLVQQVLAGTDLAIEALPNGAFMRVAIRRSIRVRDNAGLPLEDLGVIPDARHDLTRNDLLNGNEDLINAAARLLSEA